MSPQDSTSSNSSTLLASGKDVLPTLGNIYLNDLLSKLSQQPGVKALRQSPWVQLLGTYLLYNNARQTGNVPLLSFSWNP